MIDRCSMHVFVHHNVMHYYYVGWFYHYHVQATVKQLHDSATEKFAANER